MTEFQQRVLDVILAHGPVYTGAVHGHFTTTTVSAVTRAIHALQRLGYVKHPAWNDRRWVAA